MRVTIASASKSGLVLGAVACVLAGGTLAVVLLSRGGGGDGDTARTEADAVFVDRAAELGLDFQHWNGRTGAYYFCEPVGSGAALFDYDRDGDLDVYLVQGAMLGDHSLDDAIDPYRGPTPPGDRLFRNDLVETGGTLHFTDVTTAQAIPAVGYGMGVAAGDYDDDGWIDLYVTCFGENQMLRNRGDGTFEDVTAQTGTGEDRWSSSAAFLDYDRDGHLDLFVCNYVDFSFFNHKPCYSVTSARDYCGPLSFSPQPDRLFRNRGDGTFEDVSGSSQIAREYGGALGVACADLNGDGWLDLYVANDGLANQLWINQHDGTFHNEALISGCAYSGSGKAEASMGVDVADFDGDGDEDVFLAHLTDETNTLYVNDGTGLFEDRTSAAGLGSVSRSFTAFGTAWLDFDGDGELDLLTANGAVKVVPEQELAGVSFPLRQKNQLFRNLGGGRFEDYSARGGSVFDLEEVSRGAAFGDIDNDGDTDALIVNNNGPARLLVNQVGNRQAWVGLEVLERAGGRSPEGARVEVAPAGGRSRWRRVRAAASYLCANDPRVLVGLGVETAAVTARVHWLDGSVEEFGGLEPRRYHTLVRGAGAPR